MKPWTWRHAIINSTLPSTTRHVLLTLACHVNDAGEDAYPSTRTLARETGLSERSVCTHLDLAEEEGWFVKRKHGYGGQKWARNQYYPSIPEGFEIVEADEKGAEGGSVRSKRGGGKKALNDVQQLVDNSGTKGTEGDSVPSQKALNVVPEGTEPNDIKALNDVQSNTAVNPAYNPAAAATREDDENRAAAAAQKIGDEEKADATASPNAEAELLAAIAQLPNIAIDPQADRVSVLTWAGKGVTPAQLAEAHKRAIARRQAGSDSRPIYAKFLDRFVDEVLAGVVDAGESQSDMSAAQWHLSDSGIGTQGKRVRVERRPNESTPDYLIRVAKASGRGPWIDYVLKREQGGGRYQQVVEFFGDELLPVDYYPS
ncbi:helix-turn-helix domain-containing protein [Paraburkholderia sp. BR14263]|uniref:helix-turn-helix domain-containing protein n=1 Tax=unclassified Paraburkholderia TaxID=2615204 RepID=UPI0034CE0D8C